MITHERLRHLLSYNARTGDFVWLRQKGGHGNQGMVAGHKGRRNRIEIRIDGYLYLAHRLAWFYVYGDWPSNEIDHVDCDSSNNCWTNLRAATRSQNGCNTKLRINNRSGLKGVHYSTERKKWIASIKYSGHMKALGRFKTKEEAKTAYDRAALAHHAEFARLA